MLMFIFVATLLLSLVSPGQAQPDKETLSHADALFNQYRATENLEPLKQSTALLDNLGKAAPGSYDIQWRRSRAYQSLGDDTKPASQKLKLLELAVAAGKQAVEARGEGVEGHYWLGVSYGSYGEAKGMFKALTLVKNIRKEMETVIRLDAAHANGGAYVVLGKIDFELPGAFGGNKKRAIEEYEQGLKIAPSNPLLKVYLAESYIDDNRKNEARLLLDQVLSAKQTAQLSPELRDAQHEARKLYDKHFAKK